MKVLGYVLLYGFVGLIFAWYGFSSHTNVIMVPLILVSCLYLYYAINQENINKYTNWSVLSWYVGILLSAIPLGLMSSTSIPIFILKVIAIGTLLSVICVHIVGLIKGELKPKILNYIFIILTIPMVGIIYSF